MKIPLKWLTPILLRLLSLSHITLANGAAAALQNAESVHLVTGFHVGLAANLQPHDLSLDSTNYIQLTNQEFALPIMPLHLLGKKSWNVYNQDNIAKVKRDEAAAAAKEAAEEERLQEVDAERRIQILRGERPAPLPIEDVPTDHDQTSRPPRERKKRKRANEDDTDFELRLAKDQTNPSHPSTHSSSSLRPPTSNAPLTDPSGHISLSPPTPSKGAPAAPNPDAERDAARARREYEDQYTLRFANAAGHKTGLEKPWYSKSAAKASIDDDDAEAYSEMPGKDVWGNEDPRRKLREAARVAAGDPLAAMRQGAAQVRRVERERKRWLEEREREREMGEGERKRRRRDEGWEEEGLEGFSLDREKVGSASSRRRRSSEERRIGHRESHRRSHHRERDRSRDRERERNRDRDRDRDRDRHRLHKRH